ncbi:transmembrane protein 238-like isoform X1 [Sardina pilchardus]|uniref:transmembrane protein 238-like isoform X1 n=1 Tax=Sardina pilchardus TaxID=27697 RepID=UPI002E131E5B
MEKNYDGIGRCKCAFWFAVAHDIIGFLILLSGVFWDVFFHDFLLYAGAVIIFLSLIWWVFWYSGNIEVPPEELQDDVFLYKKTKGISGVVRKVSSRLTNGIRNSLRRTGRGSPRPGNGTEDTPQVPGGIDIKPCGNAQSEQPKFNREPLSV